MLMFTLVFYFISASSRSIPDLSDVEEIQHAVCRVATEEIQASANATITRQLKGVCSIKAMNQRMDEMQRTLFLELQVLKLMLQGAGFTTPKPSPVIKFLEKSSIEEDYDYTNEVEDYNTNVVKSLQYMNSSKKIYEENYPRLAEIVKNNETIVSTDLGKAFVYYWKITNVKNNFQNDLFFVSPTIHFLTSKLFIKCSTKHLGSTYVSFELLEPYVFKNNYRFILLSNNEKRDFNSPLFKPKMGKIFRVAHEELLKFAINDCLFLKLMVYLN